MKGIYAITPNDIEENELIEKSQELIEAKIDFLQIRRKDDTLDQIYSCLLYTSPSPRDPKTSRMPSSA